MLESVSAVLHPCETWQKCSLCILYMVFSHKGRSEWDSTVPTSLPRHYRHSETSLSSQSLALVL